MMHINLFLLFCVSFQLQVEVSFGSCGTYRYHYYTTCNTKYSCKEAKTYKCGMFWADTCVKHYYTTYHSVYKQCGKYAQKYDSWADWGSWGSWSSCSKSCGYGTKTRYKCRSCRKTNVPCSKSGAKAQQSTNCYLGCCPRNGGWNVWENWQAWNSCTQMCGGGSKERVRKRSCSNPSPGCGGSKCSGTSTESQKAECNTQCCLRNGGWTVWENWQAWSSCTQMCGGGSKERVRNRSCSNPSPSCGGSKCSGTSTASQKAECNTQRCPKRCFCMVSNSTRYRTYDSQRFDFMGTCKYTLSQMLDSKGNCSFNVEVKNVHHYGDIRKAYIKYVEVDVRGMRIGLFKGSKIEVNGKWKDLPFSRNGVKVFKSGGYITVLNGCGLQVKFDGKYNTNVNVPGTYRGKMTGLCGDCNGKQDDYRTKAGKDVSKETDMADMIGQSYMVPGSSCY